MCARFDHFDTQIHPEETSACERWELEREWNQLAAYDVENDGDAMEEWEMMCRDVGGEG